MKYVIDSIREQKPKGFKWACPSYYIVRSKGMEHETRSAFSLRSARSIAKAVLRLKRSPWAEIFRLAETGAATKFVFVASYDVPGNEGRE